MRTIDPDNLRCDIRSSVLYNSPSQEITELCDQYDSVLSSILDKRAPLRTRMVTLRPNAPDKLSQNQPAASLKGADDTPNLNQTIVLNRDSLHLNFKGNQKIFKNFQTCLDWNNALPTDVITTRSTESNTEESRILNQGGKEAHLLLPSQRSFKLASLNIINKLINCDMIATRYDNNTRKLMSISDVYGLQKLITEPTWVTPTSSTLMDVIYTNCPDKIVCSGVCHVSISDHSMVFAFRKLTINGVTLGHNTLTYRKFFKFNRINFRNDIASHNWDVMNNFTNPSGLLLS